MSALAYFITFHTYGSWLHGRDTGSVDRQHNQYGSEMLPADQRLEQSRRNLMTHEPYLLDASDRDIVLASIQQHCEFRQWALHAAHVRTNHVHIVVTCGKSVEQAMTEFKVYSSRALTAAHPEDANRKRWSRHGSTDYLFDETAIAAVVRYVVHGQGKPMAVHPLSIPPLPGGRGSQSSQSTQGDHHETVA